MTEIPYDLLEGHLKSLKSSGAASCYLVHGEEMLRQKAVTALCGRHLGPNPGAHQVERVDGGAAGAVSEALARVNTYSLLGDVKVVILADTRVFHDALDSRAFLEKARTAQQDDQMAKAARAFMAVLGFHRLGLDEIDADGRRRLLAAADLDPENDDWLEALIRWCRCFVWCRSRRTSRLPFRL